MGARRPQRRGLAHWIASIARRALFALGLQKPPHLLGLGVPPTPCGMFVGSKAMNVIVVSGCAATAGVTRAIGPEGDRIFRNVPPTATPAKARTNPYRSQIFQRSGFWSSAKPLRICAAARSSVIQLIRRPHAEKRPVLYARRERRRRGKMRRSSDHTANIGPAMPPLRSAFSTRAGIQSRRRLASSSDRRRTASKSAAHSSVRPRYACVHLPLRMPARCRRRP